MRHRVIRNDNVYTHRVTQCTCDQYDFFLLQTVWYGTLFRLDPYFWRECEWPSVMLLIIALGLIVVSCEWSLVHIDMPHKVLSAWPAFGISLSDLLSWPFASFHHNLLKNNILVVFLLPYLGHIHCPELSWCIWPSPWLEFLLTLYCGITLEIDD